MWQPPQNTHHSFFWPELLGSVWRAQENGLQIRQVLWLKKENQYSSCLGGLLSISFPNEGPVGYGCCPFQSACGGVWSASPFSEITVAAPLNYITHQNTHQKVIITTANVDLPSKACTIVKLLSLYPCFFPFKF